MDGMWGMLRDYDLAVRIRFLRDFGGKERFIWVKEFIWGELA